jgi:hypothetical protein
MLLFTAVAGHWRRGRPRLPWRKFRDASLRLTAEGIIHAWQKGRQDSASRLAAIAARFVGAGLDLARPYLGPAGVDLFHISERATLP